ncbi:hypothetical protein PSPO01_13934 [Paraphaeosphaeria sporulosa]
MQLHNAFLPNSPTATSDTRLEQAQPDLASGYLLSRDKGRAPVPSTRPKDQIRIGVVRSPRTDRLRSLDVTARLFLPYSTTQRKTHDLVWKVIAQGARHGAVMNEHLRALH